MRRKMASRHRSIQFIVLVVSIEKYERSAAIPRPRPEKSMAATTMTRRTKDKCKCNLRSRLEEICFYVSDNIDERHCIFKLLVSSHISSVIEAQNSSSENGIRPRATELSVPAAPVSSEADWSKGSLRAAPRRIQIAYLRPEHEDVLRACPWLRCSGSRSTLLHTYGRASYWTNVSPAG